MHEKLNSPTLEPAKPKLFKREGKFMQKFSDILMEEDYLPDYPSYDDESFKSKIERILSRNKK